jgi:hypothetical protein
MAKAGKHATPSFSFAHAIKIEVHIPKLEPLASLKSLDFDRLSKGSHKIEVGFISGGCCPKLVRAVVRNGMVTKLEVEPCKDARPLTPGMAAIAKEVRRQVLARGEGKWQPIPLAKFAAQPVVQIPGAWRWCWFDVCIICGEFGCFVEDIFHGPLR